MCLSQLPFRTQVIAVSILPQIALLFPAMWSLMKPRFPLPNSLHHYPPLTLSFWMILIPCQVPLALHLLQEHRRLRHRRLRLERCLQPPLLPYLAHQLPRVGLPPHRSSLATDLMAGLPPAPMDLARRLLLARPSLLLTRQLRPAVPLPALVHRSFPALINLVGLFRPAHCCHPLFQCRPSSMIMECPPGASQGTVSRSKSLIYRLMSCLVCPNHTRVLLLTHIGGRP